MPLTNEVINQVSFPITLEDNPKQIEALMYENIGTGIGLAAVQIGILKRIVIIKVNGKFVTICNPEIIKKSQETRLSKEGCLSFPNKIVEKKRWYRITVTGTSVYGKPLELKLSGLASYIAQHEIDHLNGVHI